MSNAVYPAGTVITGALTTGPGTSPSPQPSENNASSGGEPIDQNKALLRKKAKDFHSEILYQLVLVTCCSCFLVLGSIARIPPQLGFGWLYLFNLRLFVIKTRELRKKSSKDETNYMRFRVFLEWCSLFCEYLLLSTALLALVFGGRTIVMVSFSAISVISLTKAVLDSILDKKKYCLEVLKISWLMVKVVMALQIGLFLVVKPEDENQRVAIIIPLYLFCILTIPILGIAFIFNLVTRLCECSTARKKNPNYCKLLVGNFIVALLSSYIFAAFSGFIYVFMKQEDYYHDYGYPTFFLGNAGLASFMLVVVLKFKDHIIVQLQELVCEETSADELDKLKTGSQGQTASGVSAEAERNQTRGGEGNERLDQSEMIQLQAGEVVSPKVESSNSPSKSAIEEDPRFVLRKNSTYFAPIVKSNFKKEKKLKILESPKRRQRSISFKFPIDDQGVVKPLSVLPNLKKTPSNRSSNVRAWRSRDRVGSGNSSASEFNFSSGKKRRRLNSVDQEEKAEFRLRMSSCGEVNLFMGSLSPGNCFHSNKTIEIPQKVAEKNLEISQKMKTMHRAHTMKCGDYCAAAQPKNVIDLSKSGLSRKESMTSGKGLERSMMTEDFQRRARRLSKLIDQETVQVKPASLCTMCMEKPSDCIFEPCGHGGICLACSEDMLQFRDNCPYCRKYDTTKNFNGIYKVKDIYEVVEETVSDDVDASFVIPEENQAAAIQESVVLENQGSLQEENNNNNENDSNDENHNNNENDAASSSSSSLSESESEDGEEQQ